jgi:hypothetical protein
MLYAAVDGLMRAAPTTEEAGLDREMCLRMRHKLTPWRTKQSYPFDSGNACLTAIGLQQGYCFETRRRSLDVHCNGVGFSYMLAGRSKLHNPRKL